LSQPEIAEGLGIWLREIRTYSVRPRMASRKESRRNAGIVALTSGM